MDKNLHSLARTSLPTSQTLIDKSETCPAWLMGLPKIHLPLLPNPRLAAVTDPSGVGAEKFRALSVRLHYLQGQHNLRRIVITSAVKGEGKSVISANLAITCAHRQRTLLIDGDMR